LRQRYRLSLPLPWRGEPRESRPLGLALHAPEARAPFTSHSGGRRGIEVGVGRVE